MFNQSINACCFAPDVRKQGENERFKFSTNTGIYAAQLDGEVEIHYEYLFLTKEVLSFVLHVDGGVI